MNSFDNINVRSFIIFIHNTSPATQPNKTIYSILNDCNYVK